MSTVNTMRKQEATFREEEEELNANTFFCVEAKPSTQLKLVPSL